MTMKHAVSPTYPFGKERRIGGRCVAADALVLIWVRLRYREVGLWVMVSSIAHCYR